MIQAAVESFGSVDIVVANAGAFLPCKAAAASNTCVNKHDAIMRALCA